MKMRRTLESINQESTCSLALLICTLCLVSSVRSATMNYGDFGGTTVTFGDVTENTLGAAPLLFGSPTIIGDSLVFQPTGFGATSQNGGGVVGVDSQISTEIVGKGGAPIEKVMLREFGDFTLRGSDGEATVTTPVRWRILEIDGNPVSDPVGSGNMTFSPAGSGGNGVYQLTADEANGVLWDGMFTINFDQFLADEGVAGRVTKVRLTFDNILTATSNSADTFAFIKKKDADIGVMIVVPEPSSVALALLGIFGMLRRRP